MATTAPVKVFTKAPNAVLPYYMDWSDWLQPGEKITTSTWTPDVGITKDSSDKSASTTTVTLSGGTAGTTYDVVNKIVTNMGRTDERSLRFVVALR